MSNYRRYFSQLNNPVFITVVTKNRQQILTDNIELLRDAINNSIKKFQYKFVAGIVMPDHLHFIVYSENPNLIPKIVHDIFPKILFCHQIYQKVKQKKVIKESGKEDIMTIL